MRQALAWILMIGLIAVSSSAAYAKEKDGKEGKKPWWIAAVEGGKKEDKEAGEDKQAGEDKRPKGWDQGEKKGWGESDVPPGFEHGEKKGWGDGGMPPGLAGGGGGEGHKGKGGGKKK